MMTDEQRVTGSEIVALHAPLDWRFFGDMVFEASRLGFIGNWNMCEQQDYILTYIAGGEL